MIALFSNGASSQLFAGISSSATTAVLLAGTGELFPVPQDGQFFALTFISQINPVLREIVYVTSMEGDTVETMLRGQEGTVAQSWNAGDYAQNLITAGTLNSISLSAGPLSIALTDYYGVPLTDQSGNFLLVS